MTTWKKQVFATYDLRRGSKENKTLFRYSFERQWQCCRLEGTDPPKKNKTNKIKQNRERKFIMKLLMQTQQGKRQWQQTRRMTKIGQAVQNKGDSRREQPQKQEGLITPHWGQLTHGRLFRAEAIYIGRWHSHPSGQSNLCGDDTAN